MGDPDAQLQQGIRDGLQSLPPGLVSELDPAQGYELGRRAALVAIAPHAWRRAVGAVYDTDDVRHKVGLTESELADQVTSGALIELRGWNTTYYPRWQFDDEGHVRPAVRDILHAFHNKLGDTDPYTVATWARAPQPELDEGTPADWVHLQLPDDRVVLAAQRAANTLAE